jgi:Transposase IS116/IS110/IS902 family
MATWSLPPELSVRLTLLAEQWRFATRQLIEMRRLLREQAQAQQEIEQVYRSVPGIGEVAARTLATELGDMTRFANERALFSYTGLTPSTTVVVVQLLVVYSANIARSLGASGAKPTRRARAPRAAA